jgi:hypothetical protein
MTRQYVTAALLERIAAHLTDHDRAVLHTVSDLGFVSGDQLRRMHFAVDADTVVQARATRRALIRLTRLDCLARLPRRVGGVRSGSAGFVYRLGLAGQRVAVLYGWQPARRGRRSYVPGTFFLNHRLAVAELFALLKEGDRSRRFELLELSAEPACWREYAGGIGSQGQAILKPDAYVRLGIGDYEDSYLVEIDMGSEGSQTLGRKLREYVTYEASGAEQEARGVFPRVLWLAPDADRADAIERCIEALPSAVRELFAVARQADALDVVAGTSPIKT